MQKRLMLYPRITGLNSCMPSWGFLIQRKVVNITLAGLYWEIVCACAHLPVSTERRLLVKHIRRCYYRSAQLKVLHDFVAASTIQIFPTPLIYILQLFLSCESPYTLPPKVPSRCPHISTTCKTIFEWVSTQKTGSFCLSDHAGHIFTW